MKLEVCSICQNNCEFCAHSVLIRRDRKYQLTLDQLEKFLYFTKKSNYYIEQVIMHGPGEPLCWNHFNEGIEMIHESGVIGHVLIATNGKELSVIKERTWGYIDEMMVSVYPNLEKNAAFNDIINKYHNKIRFEDKSTFLDRDESTKKGILIPCECCCPGPMLYGDSVFLYCGPPLFNAARLKGVDPYDFPALFSVVELNYLEGLQEGKCGNLAFCKNCFANENALSIRKKNIP
jgi:radical SAM family protein